MGNSFDENYEGLPFRLKILVLREISFRSHYIDIFNRSAITLRYLELVDIQPVTSHVLLENFINKCVHLNELNLQNIYLRNLKPSASITKVTLKKQAGPALWLTGLSNLKRLRFTFQQASRECYDTQCDFRKCEKLEEVEVSQCTIRNYFQIPTVKKLTLRNIMEVKNGCFVSAQNSIEEVTVEYCDTRTDIILQEVSEKMRKVRTINVKGGIVSRETMAAVRRKCANLRNFNVRFLEIRDN
jgi:hypothetical protein